MCVPVVLTSNCQMPPHIQRIITVYEKERKLIISLISAIINIKG